MAQPAQPGQQGGLWQTGGYQPTAASNPYLDGMAGNITRQSQNFLDSNLRNINANAVLAGGYGDSGHGMAQGKAISGTADALQGNLANLYGGAYNQDQSRGLQRYGMDQGFFTAQRGQDQTGMALGANLMQQGLGADWAPLQQANGIYSPYTGFGQSTSGGQQGGGWQGALGGAIGGAQLGSNMGWW
jgi:hypothetical protein